MHRGRGQNGTDARRLPVAGAFETGVSIMRGMFGILIAALLAATCEAQSLWMPHTTASTMKPVPNWVFGLYDSNNSHVYRWLMTGDVTADRDISWDFGDSARTITLTGNPTLADWFDQAVKAASTPAFAGADLSSGTATLGTVAGAIDAGSATSFEAPNSATPTTNAAGELALDTTITDHQPLWQYYDGGENMTVIAIDTAQLPSLDNEIVKYDAASDKFVLESDGGSGAPTDATYITQTADATLSAEQALSALSSGIMRVATTTGVVTSLTDSAGIAANISDETGTGLLLFGTSPTITTDITIPNSGLHVLDTNASHDLIFTPGSDLTADRALTFTTGDAARVITLSGNPTLGDWFDQAVKAASTPTFAGADLSSGTATLGTVAGAIDAGSATSLEIPNSATPTTDAAGELALDTTITDHQPLFQYYDGGENMTIVAIDTAQLPALDNEILKYDAASDKFVLEADASGGSSVMTPIPLMPADMNIASSNPAIPDLGLTQHGILFDDTTDQSGNWTNLYSNGYQSGDIVITVIYSMANEDTGTSETIVVTGEIWAVSPGDSADVDTASWGTAVSTTEAVPDTSGYPGSFTLTFDSAGELDNLADGDIFAVRITRDADNGSDDADNDLEIRSLVLTESP